MYTAFAENSRIKYLLTKKAIRVYFYSKAFLVGSKRKGVSRFYLRHIFYLEPKNVRDSEEDSFILGSFSMLIVLLEIDLKSMHGLIFVGRGW